MSQRPDFVERFQRAYPPASAPPGTAIHLPFLPDGGDLLVRGDDKDGISLIRAEAAEAAPAASAAPLYLGTLDGAPCIAYAVRAEAADAEAGYRTVNLRSLWGRVDDDEYALAGYAAHLLHWQTISGFCSRCGTAMESGEKNTWSKQCPKCGFSVYPPVSPAVLILVHSGATGPDGGQILLAHKPGWGKRYSILAGFVEPGESLEGCVRRETMEEAGLSVTDIVYRGSQPWPFPHQVMVGFTARCEDVSQPLRLDTAELDDAVWFSLADLPDLPGKLSLSRQLIDAWIDGSHRVG